MQAAGSKRRHLVCLADNAGISGKKERDELVDHLIYNRYLSKIQSQAEPSRLVDRSAEQPTIAELEKQGDDFGLKMSGDRIGESKSYSRGYNSQEAGIRPEGASSIGFPYMPRPKCRASTSPFILLYILVIYYVAWFNFSELSS